MSDITETVSISEVLAENYLGIGAIGIGVIGAIVDDLIHGRIDDEFIHGMATSRDEVSQALTDIILSVIPYLYAMRTPNGWVQS
jgi:mannose/fructose/N-acetylgalactosamine-specific phosphotransferase system component IID